MECSDYSHYNSICSFMLKGNGKMTKGDKAYVTSYANIKALLVFFAVAMSWILKAVAHYSSSSDERLEFSQANQGRVKDFARSLGIDSSEEEVIQPLVDESPGDEANNNSDVGAAKSKGKGKRPRTNLDNYPAPPVSRPVGRPRKVAPKSHVNPARSAPERAEFARGSKNPNGNAITVRAERRTWYAIEDTRSDTIDSIGCMEAIQKREDDDCENIVAEYSNNNNLAKSPIEMQRQVVQAYLGATQGPATHIRTEGQERDMKFAEDFLQSRAPKLRSVTVHGETLRTSIEHIRYMSKELASGSLHAAAFLLNSLMQFAGNLRRAGHGAARLLCVRRKFDETPAPLKIKALRKSLAKYELDDGRTDSEEVDDDEQIQEEKGSAKVLQTLAQWRLLLEDGSSDVVEDGAQPSATLKKTVSFSGKLPTWLQALERNTGRVLARAVYDTCASVNFALAAAKRMVMISVVDRFSGNLAAWDGLREGDEASYDHILSECDVHALHTIAERTLQFKEFRLPTSAVIESAIMFSDATKKHNLRIALRKIVDESLVVVYAEPPGGEIKEYRDAILDLFIGDGGVIDSRRTTTGPAWKARKVKKFRRNCRVWMNNTLNGDWQDADVVEHYCRAGCCKNRSETVKKICKFAEKAFIRSGPDIMSRSRWLGIHESIDWHGLFTACHKLLSRAIGSMPAPKGKEKNKSPQPPLAALPDEDGDADDEQDAREQPELVSSDDEGADEANPGDIVDANAAADTPGANPVPDIGNRGEVGNPVPDIDTERFGARAVHKASREQRDKAEATVKSWLCTQDLLRPTKILLVADMHYVCDVCNMKK